MTQGTSNAEGYDFLDAIDMQSVDDIIELVGMTKPGHQKRFRMAVTAMMSAKKNPPKESEPLPTSTTILNDGKDVTCKSEESFNF